jgi:hypothetical protein
MVQLNVFEFCRTPIGILSSICAGLITNINGCMDYSVDLVIRSIHNDNSIVNADLFNNYSVSTWIFFEVFKSWTVWSFWEIIYSKATKRKKVYNKKYLLALGLWVPCDIRWGLSVSQRAFIITNQLCLVKTRFEIVRMYSQNHDLYERSLLLADELPAVKPISNTETHVVTGYRYWKENDNTILPEFQVQQLLWFLKGLFWLNFRYSHGLYAINQSTRTSYKAKKQVAVG